MSTLVGPSPVDADGGIVFASRSSRRRCSSYVVSSMLARLPAAGVGCLGSSPSCPIYSLDRIRDAIAMHAVFVEALPR